MSLSIKLIYCMHTATMPQRNKYVLGGMQVTVKEQPSAKAIDYLLKRGVSLVEKEA